MRRSTPTLVISTEHPTEISRGGGEALVLHEEPGAALQITIAMVSYPIRTVREFVFEPFATARAGMNDRCLLVSGHWMDVPGLEEMTRGTHERRRLAVGLDGGMPPEETRPLTFCEPDDVGMGPQRLLVKDSRTNVRFVVDEKVDRVIGQELVGEKELQVLLAEC